MLEKGGMGYFEFRGGKNLMLHGTSGNVCCKPLNPKAKPDIHRFMSISAKLV